MVYIDSKNKNTLTCGEVEYSEKEGRGYATKQALVRDYSQKDTLYLHADTIRLETFHINTDSMYRKVHCYNKVRTYRTDVQAVCDSMVYSTPKTVSHHVSRHHLWNMGRQMVGEVISCSSRTAPS